MKSAAIFCALALVLCAQAVVVPDDSISFPPPFANFAIVAGSVDGESPAYFDETVSIGFDSTYVAAEDDYTGQTYNYGISADWYRDAVRSPNAGPGNLQPNFYNFQGGREEKQGRWMVTARNYIDAPYEDALNVWTRNWETEIFQGNFYEIRRWVQTRTVTSSPFKGINLEDPNGPTIITIPFAVWNLGPNASDTSDDYQMIVIVTDANENNIFDFWQIASKEGSVSDYMTFMAKTSPQLGNIDYLEWLESEDPTNFTDYIEHIADVSLFNWHNYQKGDGSAFSGPLDAAPGNGAIFRIGGGFYPPRCFFRTVTAIPYPQTVYRITAAGGINKVTRLEPFVVSPEYVSTFEEAVGDTEGYLTSTYGLFLSEELLRENFETQLKIQAGDGFAYCDVGEHLTNHGFHYVGNTAFTTFNEGDIHDSFYKGEGFVYEYKGLLGDYVPTIQGGSLWVSNPASGDVFYGYNGRQHWTATGDMYTSINYGDQDTNSSFEDSYEDETFRVFQLDVNSVTSTWRDDANDDFAIFWYNIINSNVHDLVNAQIGLFVDGGIAGNFDSDTTNWDAENEILYTYSTVDGPEQRFVGVKCLSHPPSSATTFINDPTTDAEIVTIMTNPVPTIGEPVGDQKMVLSATVSIPAFRQDLVVFGIVLGNSVEELRSNAQAMVAKYTVVVESELCFADLNLCAASALPCDCIENLMRCTEDAGRSCPRFELRQQLAEICALGDCNEGCCANLFNECENEAREVCFDLAPVPTPSPTPIFNNTNVPSVVNSPVFFSSSASTLSVAISALVMMVALLY